MPMRYANEPDVLSQLRLDTGDPDAAANIERVTRLENGLCDAFDEKIDRTFGTAPVAETRVLTVGASRWSPTVTAMLGLDQSPRLVTHTGIRSLDSIDVDGEWDGAAWIDGETLTAADYRLVLTDRNGVSWAIDRIGGSWRGVVRVTAIWDDQVTEAVPDDVREALTFITVDQYRTEKASPAGDIGPDGLTVRPRNPWSFELVKEAVNRHRLVEIAV